MENEVTRNLKVEMTLELYEKLQEFKAKHGVTWKGVLIKALEADS